MDSETKRLEVLRSFCVLDTPPEERFDRLTALAADLFEAPIALVSLVDSDRQWFKSHHGLAAAQTHRDLAFCDHVLPMGPDAVMVVEDARLDDRFAANALVTGEPGIRFYMGAALTARDGFNLGTLCIIDTKPRPRPSDREIGRLQALARVVIDELELGAAQRDLREQNHLLALAEAASGVGRWRLDLIGGGLAWSDEVYRIHGVDRASFDPNLDSAVGFYHPDDQSVVAGLIDRAKAEGVGYEFSLRVTRADGALRHVVSRATCDIDENGRATAIFGVFQDVTDHVEALEAAQRSEARYRLLTETANDVVAEIGFGGIVTYMSPAITALTGYLPEELIGKPLMDIFHPEDRATAVERFQRALQEGGDGRNENRIFAKDGRMLWIEGRPTEVMDPATGKRRCVTDVFRDITERKAMEAALRDATAQAEQAAAVKSEFMANMSHELRTPLSSILGYSELLKPHVADDETARHYLSRTVEASEALLATVNDILDFSKLEAGHVEIALRPVEVAPLFHGVTQLLAPQADAKGLALSFQAADAVPALAWLDDTRVRQILLNLVSNAVKFTQEGGIVIGLSHDAAEGMFRCEVTDTGQGIPADRQDRLFQRFSQVDASTTRSHGGTGLGLVICKGLAEAMGGRVGVSSAIGEGSTFWFELPCQPVEENLAATAAELEEPVFTALDGLRLLVTDDNLMNRELVRLLMAVVGAEVSEAAGGEEAIALAEGTPFDIILMDVRMPGLSGPDAARAIREGGGCNSLTPLIAFTADADEDSIASSWGDVFDAVVAKPIVAANLYAVLNRVVSTPLQQVQEVAAHV